VPTVTTTDRGTAPREAGAYTEVSIDDKLVRDHRGGDAPPIDLPPNVHAPDSRRVQPSLTTDLTNKVRAVVEACGAGVPSDALGANPKVEGQIVIAIKGGQVSVTRATMQLRDVSRASVAPAKQCIEEKSLAVVASAPDERDLDSYAINLVLPFP
jgi:hypothetical protein